MAASYSGYTGGGPPNVASYGYTPRFRGNAGRRTIGFDNTKDPESMARNDRAIDQETGDLLGEEYGQDTDFWRNQELGATGRAESQYDPIWRGEGGYNADERRRVYGDEGLSQLPLTEQEQRDSYLREDEEAGIRGDPNKAAGYYDPGYLEDTNYESAARERGQFDEGKQRLRTGVSNLRQGYADAIDPSRLRMSGGYEGQMQGAVTEGAAGMRGAAYDPSLQLSDRYQQKRPVSDQEVQQMEYLSGSDAGMGYQGAIGRMEEQARAAGTSNPLALAAMRSRLEREGGAASTKAMLQGRIAAREAQRSGEQQLEDTRLGAANARTGYRMDAENTIAGRRMDATRDVEDTRLRSERDLSDRYTRAAEGTGQAELGVEGDITQTGIGLETGIGRRSLDVRERNQDRGIGLTERADAAGSGRAQTIATNRQGTAQGLAADRFNRGYQINQAQSERGQAVGGARRQDESEGRQAAVGFADRAGARYQQTQQNRLGAWGQQQQGRQAATSTVAGYKSANPSFGRTLTQGLAQVPGKVLTSAISGRP
jgi:hypothetical protein